MWGGIEEVLLTESEKTYCWKFRFLKSKKDEQRESAAQKMFQPRYIIMLFSIFTCVKLDEGENLS